MASTNSANSSRKRSSSQPSILDAFKRPKCAQPTNPQPQKNSSHPQPSTKHTPSNTSSSSSTTLQIIESTGDIFSAPANTLLIHACNCQASWSAGIAKAFKQKHPKAFPKYASHCKAWTPNQLFSTALLITPPDNVFDSTPSTSKGERQTSKDLKGVEDEDSDDKEDSDDTPGNPATHSVGCLFTSHHYGRRKDTPAKILEATKPAMEDLLRQVDAYNATVDEERKIKHVRMCKINSGLFDVPWQKTRRVLEGIDVRGCGMKTVRVVSLEE